jgi:hypothetical protein
LAKYILREKNISAILADAPGTLEIPESQQSVSAPSYDIFVDELGYYERELVKLPYKKKRRYILFIKIVSIFAYINIAIYSTAQIMGSSNLGEGYKTTWTLTMMFGWIPFLIAISKICGVLFGYKKKPRTKKHILIRMWRKFWDN